MAKLLRMYREAGFRIQTGLNSYHFQGWRDAPFTLLYQDEKLVETGGGGVSLYEIPFLEHLSLAADFRSIFIVGNSFGWSTLLTGLLWPRAKVVALDCGLSFSRDWAQRLLQRIVEAIAGHTPTASVGPDFGIDLTNQLARQHALNVHVVKGYSPQDVPQAVSGHLPSPPDLVFIDGHHTPAQILLDFDAARKIAAPHCVYLFHDVVNWKLAESFAKISQTPGMFGTILWRTTSGFGFLCPREQRERFEELLGIFNEPAETIQSLPARLRRRMLADQVSRIVLQNRLAVALKRLLIRR
jgi:hypothetical protein